MSHPDRDPDADAVAAAHAVYTPFTLAFYDLIVHGLSNRFAWRCSTARLKALYAANLSANHLEAGVGTGLFIDSVADHVAGDRPRRLTLLDINASCLQRAMDRLQRFNPDAVQANLLEPLPAQRLPYNSVALTYVLHCLPGTMEQKLAATDHLRPLMKDGGVLFGATILGRGVAPNLAARKLLDVYNEKGVFNNRMDDRESLERGLRQRFSRVDIEQEGCVAIFRAT
jgi:hypothetical protein